MCKCMGKNKVAKSMIKKKKPVLGDNKGKKQNGSKMMKGEKRNTMKNGKGKKQNNTKY